MITDVPIYVDKDREKEKEERKRGGIGQLLNVPICCSASESLQASAFDYKL